MQNFVKAQTEIVNKRVEEAEKQKLLESSLTQTDQNQPHNNSTAVTNENQLINGTLQNTGPDQSEIIVSK